MNQSDTITELLKVVDEAAPSATNAPVLSDGDETLSLLWMRLMNARCVAMC